MHNKQQSMVLYAWFAMEFVHRCAILTWVGGWITCLPPSSIEKRLEHLLKCMLEFANGNSFLFPHMSLSRVCRMKLWKHSYAFLHFRQIISFICFVEKLIF